MGSTSDLAVAEATGMAGRYATALFELARDKGELEAVAADLARIGVMLDTSPDLAALAASPILNRDSQGKAMAAVLERAKIGETVRKFVGLIAAKRRLYAFRAMAKAFNAILAHHRGQVSADVTSARTLSAEQAGHVKAALKTALGHDVAVHLSVDPALIGGLVVKVGSRMIDNSIRTKLANLKIAMKRSAGAAAR